MRPLEILLLLANLLTFLVLAVPRLHALRWTRYSAPVALLIAGVQVLVEGPRWQMVPAYAMAGLFFLVWLLPNLALTNPLAAGLAVGLGALGLAVSIALPVLIPVFHFPHPTGPYAIGTLTYHWVDASRPELFTPDPNDHRELMAQVWYPARDEPSAPRAPYILDADAVAPALARLTRFPGFFLTHFRYVTTNAVASAPVADNASRYPVLIYLTGLGGFRSASTFQIEELVSHGYVVVGLDQPGGAAMVRYPDGRQISGWPKAEINSLVMQSVEPQPEAPTLDGKAMPEGITPYFGQDASFALDQLAAIDRADPYHILTGQARPRSRWHLWHFAGWHERRRGLPERSPSESMPHHGRLDDCGCRPIRIETAHHVHHPRCGYDAPRARAVRRLDGTRDRGDPIHDARGI